MLLEDLDQLIRLDYYTWNLKNDEIESIGNQGKEMTNVRELPITLKEIEQKLEIFLGPGILETLLTEGEVMFNAKKSNDYDQCKIEVIKEVQQR